MHHELRRLSSDTRLVFGSRPTSLGDLPPDLPAAPENLEFLALKASLENKRHILRLLPLLGTKDIDRRRGKLLERVSEELGALASRQSIAWEREKLLAGLYGFPDEGQVSMGKVYDSSAYYDLFAHLQAT